MSGTAYYYHPTHSSADPRLNLNNPTQTFQQFSNFDTTATHKSEDEIWLEKWLQEKVNYNNYNPQTLKYGGNSNKPEIPIHEAKNSLKYCLAVLDKLTKTQENLQTNINTMSTIEWKEQTNDIGKLKDQFTQAMIKFESSEAVSQLRRNVQKRRKKRERNKLRKQLRKTQVTSELQEKQNEDKQADLWLEQMKDKVERAKMDENFKKDADCILSEVTKRKSEAKKQLSLVQALIKLRHVREQAAFGRGESVTEEDNRAFNQVTKKLKEMWESRLRMYSKEEQGLKLMLEETAEKDTKAAKSARQNKIVQEWESFLFGPKQPPNDQVYFALTAAERDMETFVAIRRSWDTFLVPHDNPNGTNIPIGWVLPKTNMELWNRYLRR